jgi:nitrate/nitrite transporter NarK
MIEKSEIGEKSEKVIASLGEQRLREVSSSSFGASTAKSHHAAVAHEAGDDHLCHLQLTPAELVSSPLAWHLITCFITTTAPSVYFAGTFKTYGADYINNQSFLTNIANICNLFNSLGRIFWGEIADLIGPVQTLKIVSGVASFVISTYFYATSTKSEFLFSFYTCAIMFCIGGDFTLYLPVTMEIFGEANAGQNYGLIYACYTLFSVLNIVVLSGLGVQFSIASTTMGLLTVAGFLNLILFSIHAKIYDVKVSSKRMKVRSSIFSGKFDHLHHGPNAHH